MSLPYCDPDCPPNGHTAACDRRYHAHHAARIANEIVHLPYRGYTIVHDDRAADIWQGALYITTEYTGVDAAKRVVDEWLNAK